MPPRNVHLLPTALALGLLSVDNVFDRLGKSITLLADRYHSTNSLNKFIYYRFSCVISDFVP